MIIGLSGYARSGKDEAAKILVREMGFTRVAFADKLRDFLYALNPLAWIEGEYESKWTDPVRFNGIRVQDIINEHGWDGYKETQYGTEIRGLLQRLGTEAGRGVLGESVWIDAVLNNLDPHGRYVVSDVRFENEADAIRRRGGKLWRVTRTGVGPANDHPSETSLDDYDFDVYVQNDSILEAYHRKVTTLAKWEV